MLVGDVDAVFNPQSNMDHPLAFYSDRWFETWRFAAGEAERLAEKRRKLRTGLAEPAAPDIWPL